MATSQLKKSSDQRACAPSLFDIPKSLQNPNSKNVYYMKSQDLTHKPENQQEKIDELLKTIFIDSKDESKLLQARKILGEEANGISDDELLRSITEFQYLADSWLDDFEKQIFDNKTLNQVLKEGQNGTTNR